MFMQTFNPTTGKTEWKLQGEHEEEHSLLASAYGDMLHDEDRVRHTKVILLSPSHFPFSIVQVPLHSPGRTFIFYLSFLSIIIFFFFFSHPTATPFSLSFILFIAF